MLNDTQLSLLGDPSAPDRMTESGKILPCHCGGKCYIVCYEKQGIPSGDSGYVASIKCSECGVELRRWAMEKKWAWESAVKAWNTRAPVLTPEQIKKLEEGNHETDL